MKPAVYTFMLKDFFLYWLVFARFAGFMAFLPGFGEVRVPMALRLLMALFLALATIAGLGTEGISWNQAHLPFEGIILVEFLIGIFAALAVRAILAALDIAGATIGFNMGLANVFTNSLATAQQTGLPSVFLTYTAIVFLFVLDFHHFVLEMLVSSYQLLHPNHYPSLGQSLGDMGQSLLRITSASFMLGIQLSFPIIMLNLLMFVGAGILNRLVPTVQVFFILQPVQIFLGLFVLLLSFPLLMRLFTQHFDQLYRTLWGGNS